ncbi:thioredoxin [Candidatus Gracilibacteria bacterium]|nr:thioredoxin [Candidatus Gracilibacteria bacterium]
MEITKDNFEAETSKDMILLDFWAEWCGPCQAMMPTLAELEKSGTKVGKINVDEQQELAAQFRVMSIPTFILFKDGKAVEQIIGGQSLEQLQTIVKKHS